MRIVVVFPEPLGPRKPVTRPSATAKPSRSTATTSPNRFVSSVTSIVVMAPPCGGALGVHLVRRLPRGGAGVAGAVEPAGREAAPLGEEAGTLLECDIDRRRVRGPRQFPVAHRCERVGLDPQQF